MPSNLPLRFYQYNTMTFFPSLDDSPYTTLAWRQRNTDIQVVNMRQ
jgi:hypothetical protein